LIVGFVLAAVGSLAAGAGVAARGTAMSSPTNAEMSTKASGFSPDVGKKVLDELPPIPSGLPGWMKSVLRWIESTLKYFTKKVPKPVTVVDIDAYAGRWYNVRYDIFTTLFNSPDCSSAFYAVANKTEDGVTVFVNNSGLDYSLTGKGKPIYLTGEATNSGPPAGDLALQLEGVPRVATYRIAKLGPATFGAGYYQYSIVTDDSGLSLYVLARDVDAYFDTYDKEVKEWLKEYGFKGPLWKTYKNEQENCPDSIYSGNPWDPVAPVGMFENHCKDQCNTVCADAGLTLDSVDPDSNFAICSYKDGGKGRDSPCGMDVGWAQVECCSLVEEPSDKYGACPGENPCIPGYDACECYCKKNELKAIGPEGMDFDVAIGTNGVIQGQAGTELEVAPEKSPCYPCARCPCRGY